MTPEEMEPYIGLWKPKSNKGSLKGELLIVYSDVGVGLKNIILATMDEGSHKMRQGASTNDTLTSYLERFFTKVDVDLPQALLDALDEVDEIEDPPF